jgi:hypothetical protein
MAGAVVLLLIEYARFPLSIPLVQVAPRPVDALLRADTDDVAVLEWPMYPAVDGNAMLMSVFHTHRVVNGWGGFVPDFTLTLSSWLTEPGPPFPTTDAQTALRQVYPLRYLVVRLPDVPEDTLSLWHALRGDPPPLLRFRGVIGAEHLYELQPLPERGTRLWRLVSYEFLRRHPNLHVGLRPVDPDPALDQWVDVELNGRPVQRLAANQDATGAATLSPPFHPVQPNQIVLTHRYRYRAPPLPTDTRYQIGGIGRWMPRDLSVRSAGQPHGNLASIRLDGVEMAPNRRGYNLLALDPGGRPLAVAVFDTFARPEAAHDLAAWIRALDPGTIVVGAVKDEASGLLSAEAVAALSELGVSGDLRGQFHASHAFVGAKGAPPKTALEARGSRAVSVMVGQPDRSQGVELTDFRLEDS